ncbi:hypothetical protein R5R35_010394 [Gryllus longicercus]|uniref:Uncharacterized protein n=1 Tax=Gryllus longicercus TaxID=2509291 RepID=A0AAN9V717_9ORTH
MTASARMMAPPPSGAVASGVAGVAGVAGDAGAVRLSRQPVVDLVVAMVSVPLLVVFGLMLESNMRGDWAADADSRWNVLGLGLALLLVSLLVCCYVTHRLGICIWSAHNRQHQARLAAATGRHHPGALSSVSSQLHLVSELPPSYDSVVGYDLPPPPYCTVLAIYDQKPPAAPAPLPVPPPQAPPPPRGAVPGTG